MRKASKNKHPAMEDRAAIDVLVGTGLSFSAIARRVFSTWARKGWAGWASGPFPWTKSACPSSSPAREAGGRGRPPGRAGA